MKKPYSRAYRKNFVPEPTSASAKASKALALAKKAQASTRQELKYHEVSSGATLMGPAGVVFLGQVTSLSGGTGSNQRIGNAVKPKSIVLRLNTLYNPLAETGGQLYRIIVFQNLLTGSPAAVTEYLNTARYDSFKSIDNRFNTKTLYDQTFSVTQDNPQRNHLIKLKVPKPIYYPGATTTPEKNGVYIICISNEVTLLNSPFIQGRARFFFTE